MAAEESAGKRTVCASSSAVAVLPTPGGADEQQAAESSFADRTSDRGANGVDADQTHPACREGVRSSLLSCLRGDFSFAMMF